MMRKLVIPLLEQVVNPDFTNVVDGLFIAVVKPEKDVSFVAREESDD